MLAAIGETFETPFPSTTTSTDSSPSPLPATFSDEVTGVIVSSRKAFYRINIWTRTSSPEVKARIETIGRHFKYGVLGLEEGLKISERDKVSSDVEFVSHKDSQAKVSVCFFDRASATCDATEMLMVSPVPLLQYGTKVQKWTV